MKAVDMMKKLATQCETVQSSQIRIMFNQALKRQNCLNLSIGEPDFNTPDHICNAAKSALDEGKTRYTMNAGIPELRVAIETQVQKEYGLNYPWDSQIIVTGGGTHALMMTMMVLLDPGDEVLVAEPYWGNHIEQIRLCGAIPVFVPSYEEDHFIPTIDNLDKALTNRTKALLICSPSNPTGSVINKQSLEALAQFAIQNDLYVISDDVYSRFIFDDQKFQSIAALDGMADRTIMINSFSKTYAMTGWRVGYALGSAPIISNMIKFEENVISCVNTPAQYGAVAALQGNQSVVDVMRDTYQKRRDFLVREINKIPGIRANMPKGAFYLFANISECGLDSWDFALKLLDEQGVVVVPGTAFGNSGEGFIRISYATSMETISESLNRMNDFAIRCRK